MDTPVVLRPWAICLLIASGLSPYSIAAQVPPSAYQQAAQAAGVPPAVLYAVALQESGIHLRGQRRPWPWTLNISGRSHYFSSRTEACLAIHQALTQVKPTRIDVGLAQLNIGYQRDHYSTPCELLTPYRNLTVAALILRQHRQTGEDWLPAIGRYHRPAGGPIAASYTRRVSEHLLRLQSGASQ